jgi:hypothetical protein
MRDVVATFFGEKIVNQIRNTKFIKYISNRAIMTKVSCGFRARERVIMVKWGEIL